MKKRDFYPDIEQAFLSIREHFGKDIGPKLEGTLIPAENMDRIQKVVHGFHDIPYSRCGFECTLDPVSSKGDFSLSLTREQAELAIEKGFQVRTWLGDEESMARNRIEKFLVHWLDKKSLFYYCINTIYLEIDASNTDQSKMPGLFIRLYNGNGNAKWLETIALAVLDSLDIALTNEKRQFIEKYFRCFAGMSDLFHLGVMLTRENSPLKLVVMNIEADKASQALEAFGCEISGHMKDEDWDRLILLSSGVVNLSLDFTDKVEKRVGIEIDAAESVDSLLQWLVEKGCCSEEKKQAVCNWAGRSGNFTITRRISHFKLVIKPDNPMQAKCYLEYSI